MSNSRAFYPLSSQSSERHEREEPSGGSSVNYSASGYDDEYEYHTEYTNEEWQPSDFHRGSSVYEPRNDEEGYIIPEPDYSSYYNEEEQTTGNYSYIYPSYIDSTNDETYASYASYGGYGTQYDGNQASLDFYSSGYEAQSKDDAYTHKDEDFSTNDNPQVPLKGGQLGHEEGASKGKSNQSHYEGNWPGILEEEDEGETNARDIETYPRNANPREIIPTVEEWRTHRVECMDYKGRPQNLLALMDSGSTAGQCITLSAVENLGLYENIRFYETTSYIETVIGKGDIQVGEINLTVAGKTETFNVLDTKCRYDIVFDAAWCYDMNAPVPSQGNKETEVNFMGIKKKESKEERRRNARNTSTRDQLAAEAEARRRERLAAEAEARRRAILAADRTQRQSGNGGGNSEQTSDPYQTQQEPGPDPTDENNHPYQYW